MCGIALIISGVKLNFSNLIPNSDWSLCPCQDQEFLFSEEDLKAALQRRGPDNLGATTVYINSIPLTADTNDYSIQSFIKNEEAMENGNTFSVIAEFRFIGATLQLRGDHPVVQPLIDLFGNVLVYNGEIFGGLDVGWDGNDTEILLQSLGQCCLCVDVRSCGCSERNQQTVPDLLSRLKGPWALIFWQESSKILWFGRDALGRRSLLVHWPTCHDPRLLLSSVSPPPSSTQRYYDIDREKGNDVLNFWEELPCGVYSICMSASRIDGHLKGEVRKHDWTVPEVEELIAWERISIKPDPESISASIKDTLTDFSSHIGCVPIAPLTSSQKVLTALRESVMRRTTSSRIYKILPENHRSERCAPVAVLFSGGLDSMIIAALLHQCLEPEYEVDLLNVSFDGESAPDRVSGRAGLKELMNIARSRRWNLVEIDADLPKLTSETKHAMNLINPAKTYMDLNIGLALWLAAKGDGRLYEENNVTNGAEIKPIKYKSEAKILLVGSGADEQCAGYGRYRTKFRNKSWVGLNEEMRLDMQRIWKRNLGRDDRCIADNGKEARFPFLDEDVIKTLLDIPLWEIADLEQPSGVGDKKILREVARLLGLHQVAVLPKRAIQFGSRIARESNKKNFGSNRAANQVSAGSVVIYNNNNHNE